MQRSLLLLSYRENLNAKKSALGKKKEGFSINNVFEVIKTKRQDITTLNVASFFH
jgi:hypothetical protein